MRSAMIWASVVFSLATGIIAAILIVRDYNDTLARAEERTIATARMIGAHGNAAAESALQILSGTGALVARWDLHDETAGREIHERLREATSTGSLVSSAWVLDPKGENLADSWTYPAKPVNGFDRDYFQAHLKGAADPVIMPDNKPGSISGKRRFTVSRALRNPDGTLHAVVVVGIYTEPLERLYTDAANWPGARAGLYTVGGGVLARVQTVGRASPGFIAEMERLVQTAATGTRTLTVEPEARIVSWYRSEALPQLFATSSVTRSAALAPWWDHTIYTALLTAGASVVFWAYAYIMIRNGEASQRAAANELAVREIHHRLKNSLQLISSLINMRARRFDDPELRDLVNEITNDLRAVAEVHTIAHNASAAGTLDIGAMVEKLCSYLKTRHGKQVTCRTPSHIIIDANHATALSVIVNELVTNGIKHASGDILVSCAVENDSLVIAVHSSGAALPENFTLHGNQGFGLRALQAMLAALHGTISCSNDAGAVVFTVSVPMKEISPKRA